MRERRTRVLRPFGALDRGLNRSGQEHAADLRLLEGPLGEALRHYGIEVDESPCRCGDGDAVLERDVLRVEAADAVKADAGALNSAAAGWDGHVDRRIGPRREQLPVRGGRSVTQDCASAARENGGNEATLPSELLVPEGVHATPEALQPVRRNAVLDGSRQ